MCDGHEIVEAEGVWAETLYSGAGAMQAMSTAARREIADFFGEVPYLDRQPARLSPKDKLARLLVQRHVKNAKDLVEPLAQSQ